MTTKHLMIVFRARNHRRRRHKNVRFSSIEPKQKDRPRPFVLVRLEKMQKPQVKQTLIQFELQTSSMTYERLRKTRQTHLHLDPLEGVMHVALCIPIALLAEIKSSAKVKCLKSKHKLSPARLKAIGFRILRRKFVNDFCYLKSSLSNSFDANLFRRLIQMQSRCIDETVREAAS